MESAPEGYRRNVGVCLINPSRKVSAFLCGYVCVHVFLFVFLCWYVYMFVLGLWDFLFWADFCCFKAGYTQCLANAAGTFFFFFFFLNELF
jgi:hypothetical protein